MSKAKSNEVVEKKEQLPADLESMIYDDAGAGMENMTKDDFAIPRLSILQSNSPAAEKRTETYVEGAEAGMFIENVSNGLFDGEKGIVVVPISYRRTIIEWKLRQNGGGLVADHGYQPEMLKNLKMSDIGGGKTALLNEKANQLVDTAEYFVYIVDADGWSPAVISMASTQLRKSKRWNTLIDSVKINGKNGRVTPASYYMSYHLTTIPESNDKGSWFGWEIKKNGATIDLEFGKDIYLAAREFNSQIREGAVKVADPVNENQSGDDDSPM